MWPKSRLRPRKTEGWLRIGPYRAAIHSLTGDAIQPFQSALAVCTFRQVILEQRVTSCRKTATRLIFGDIIETSEALIVGAWVPQR